MEALIGHYGDEMRPGDMYIMNDPFDGGIHLPDIFIIKPVFVGEDLIGFAATVAHHGDIGGRVAGSAATDNTEIFQEGIRIPWTRLYVDEKPVGEFIKLLLANVRLPRMTLGDINAQVAACRVGESSLRAIADRYGASRLRRLMTSLVDHTEELMRSEISKWPDGSATFTDYIDSDGLEMRDVPIRATVTVDGDELIVDLSESAPMVKGALNSTRSFSEATAYHVALCAVAVRIPTTSGAFRPIRVITEPGTIVHVTMPGASSMRGVTGFRVYDAINGALAQLMPKQISAAGEGGNSLAIFSGTAPNGEEFVYFELIAGTWGANAQGDGNDGLCNIGAGVANIPVEVAESEYPILIERYGLVQDSGGPGKFRGGLAIERSWRCLVDASLLVRTDRQTHAPYGLEGGEAGGLSSNFIQLDGSATERSMPAMFSTNIPAGSIYRHVQPGGGGWGPPYDRDPELVALDVRNEKVSAEVALEVYGVAIDRDGIVDYEATNQARNLNRSTSYEGK